MPQCIGAGDMRLGCWTPLRAEDDGAGNPLQAAIDGIREAEDQGFDMALVAERWLGPWLEAWHLATAVALSTRKIELITAVHPGILNPQVVAKFGTTLHAISEGRCAINVVNGWQQDELDVYGNGGWLCDPEKRYKRMDEFIRVVRGLWTDSSFALNGEFYRVNSNGLPIALPVSPAPRIYATSRSDTGQSIIARSCDVWFIDAPAQHRRYENNFASIAALVKTMDERCRALGRRVDYCLNTTVLCLDDLNGATARADELEVKARNNRQLLIPGGVRGLGGGLVGSPSIIVERMQRYRDIGISGFMLRFIPQPAGRTNFLKSVAPQLH
jgi:FMNH2-dependent dimethyl sulfone monooxygenase